MYIKSGEKEERVGGGTSIRTPAYLVHGLDAPKLVSLSKSPHLCLFTVCPPFSNFYPLLHWDVEHLIRGAQDGPGWVLGG